MFCFLAVSRWSSVAVSAGCQRTAGEALCSGHGTCDTPQAHDTGTCQCLPGGTWTGEHCSYISLSDQMETWAFPLVGPRDGGTDVAVVLHDLNLTGYHEKEKMQLVMWQGEGVFRREIVCLAYEMETPWAAEQNKRAGAALGWAALAPTYVRKYGEGYHIYDDNQTQLHKQNVSRKSNVTAFEFRTLVATAPGTDFVTSWSWNLDLVLTDDSASHTYTFNTSQFQFEFYQDKPTISATFPLSTGFSGGARITTLGTRFHKEGEAYTDATWLRNTVIRLKIGPETIPREPWWPADQHIYVPYNRTSDGTKVHFFMPPFPTVTANVTTRVQFTRNRQQFYEHSGIRIVFENVPVFQGLIPAVNDKSHLVSLSLVPLGETTTLLITGTGFLNTSLIRVKLLAPPGYIPENTTLGTSKLRYVSENVLELVQSPTVPVELFHFPPASCSRKANAECYCENWMVKNPTWLIDSECCMQPFEMPRAAPWCYCLINPVAGGTSWAGKKVIQHTSQQCDPMYTKTPTFDMRLIISLDETYGDYVSHPFRLSIYVVPYTRLTVPTHVILSEQTQMSLYGGPWLNSDLLQGRVLVNGSTAPIEVNFTFVSTTLMTFWTPIWQIHNTSVNATISLTFNSFNWHIIGTYTYEMPSYSKTVPSDPDANGGTLVTVIGKKLMNVSTAAVRLRATRGLLIELSRLQQERSAIQRAIVAAGVAERDLRSRATRTDVFDATELRRMEREAYEEPMWLHDHRRRPEGEYLNISERINRAKIEKTEECLQSGHTYVIPSLYASESALTFVWPKMCVSDVELLVEIDITHNLPAGEWAYQMDVLNLYTYNQSRYPEPAAQILDLDRSAVNTLNGFAEIGTFEGTLASGPMGEDISHAQRCKYLFRGQEKFRYNAKGVFDTDPQYQIPNPILLGDSPREDVNHTPYDVVHCYKVLRKPVVSAGKRDGYLTKYNSTNQMIWSVRMGGQLDDEMTSITTDWVGNLYVSGHFIGSNFSLDSKLVKQMVDDESVTILYDENITQTSKQIRKLFVAKYDSSGSLKFAVEVAACYQARETCRIRSIDVDKYGNIYVTGLFHGIVTLGSMCASPHCDTHVQSEMDRTTFKHAAWQDTNLCNVTTSLTSCKRIPVVKMKSINRCGPEYSGHGRACEGDVFLAMLDPTGHFVWGKNLNTQNTFHRHTPLKEATTGVVEAWSNRAYWAYFASHTLKQGKRHEYDLRTPENEKEDYFRFNIYDPRRADSMMPTSPSGSPGVYP